MSATHSPITPSQRAVLERAPIEGTHKELVDSGDYQDLSFLTQIGLLAIEGTHIDIDRDASRFRYTRTDKPIPE